MYGTKPVSLSIFCKYKDVLTEEEKEQVLKDHPNARQKRYDYEANYDKWLQIKDRFQIKQYLFGAFPGSFGKDEFDVIVFVNIEMALRTLLNYYEHFHRVLGDFDPFQVVFEVENRGSMFWNAILKNHALIGILLGFGADNSQFFDWNMKYIDEQNKMGDFVRSLPSCFNTDEDIENYGPNNFELPVFKVFGLYPDTGIVQTYKKEREQIKQLYKGRNEVDVALEWLTR